MHIPLDLKRHCIQTAIKRKYNQLISTYFQPGTPERKETIESEISVLKQALETFDFAGLRSTFPALRGGGADEINLVRDADNTITLSINGRMIHATYQNHKLL